MRDLICLQTTWLIKCSILSKASLRFSEDHEPYCHCRYVLLPFFSVFWGEVTCINTNHVHKDHWPHTSCGFGQGKTVLWLSPYQGPVKHHRHHRQGVHNKIYIGNTETLGSCIIRCHLAKDMRSLSVFLTTVFYNRSS